MTAKAINLLCFVRQRILLKSDFLIGCSPPSFLKLKRVCGGKLKVIKSRVKDYLIFRKAMKSLMVNNSRFDDFELDRAKRLVLKVGNPVALNSETFDLLKTPIERRGEVSLAKTDCSKNQKNLRRGFDYRQ